MAPKVNKRFVAILAAALVAIAVAAIVLALTVGSAGLPEWLSFLRSDPYENLAQGQTLISQGKVREGVELIGRAVGKRPSDVRLILAYADALDQLNVEDARTARELVERMVKSWARACDLEPGNPEPLDKFMRFWLKVGHEMGGRDPWNRMHERAQIALRNSPGLVLARKYRGIAQVNRMQFLDLVPEERLKAQEDLEAALAKDAEDPDVPFYLVTWCLMEADIQQRTLRDANRAKELRDQARQIMEQHMANRPDDLRRQLDRVPLLLRMGQRPQAVQLLGEVEQRVLANPPTWALMLRLAATLEGADREAATQPAGTMPGVPPGRRRAEAVLRLACQKWPQDIRPAFCLANSLMGQGRVEEAVALYKQGRDMKIHGAPLEALQIADLQVQCSMRTLDLEIKNAMQEPDPERKKQALDAIEGQIRQLAASLGESGPVNLLNGKLAFARGQFAQATILLDKASRGIETHDPQERVRVLLLSAEACRQIGELGDAAERLEKALELRPYYLPVRTELARLRLQLKQFDEVEKHLAEVLRAIPDDYQALQIKAMLLAQKGQTKDAIALYTKLDPGKRPELVYPLANLLVLDGNAEAARQLVEPMFAKDPANLRNLQLMIRLAGGKEKALEYIKKAREAKADEQALNFLEQQLEKSVPWDQAILGMIDKEDDPFNREWYRFNMLNQMGRRAEAAQALAKAAQLKPDHPLVIDAQFQEALWTRNWEQAQGLAAKAAMLNVDLAEGMFYYGQIALTRGDVPRAITSFRRGLALRPVFSEGWRQLGDALRLAGDVADATASYRKALEQRPNNVAAMRGLAIVLDTQDRFDQALDLLRNAIRYAPQDRMVIEQYLAYEEVHGEPKRVLDTRRAVALRNPADRDNRRSLAMALGRHDQFGEAQKVVDALLKEEGPTRPNLEAAIAVRLSAADTQGARKILDDYLKSRGDKADADDYIALARFCNNTGKFDEAVAAYRKAVPLEDKVARTASRELGDLLFERQQFVDAAKVYGELWQANPTDKRLALRHAESLLRGGQVAQARQTLAKVNSDLGVDANSYILESLIAHMEKKVDEALKLLDKAEELSPRRALIPYHRAVILLGVEGRERDVMANLTRSLELDPRQTLPRQMKVAMHVRRGEQQEAIAELTALIKFNPRHVTSRKALAELLDTAGEYATLKNLLEESGKLFPDDTTWLRWQARMDLRDGKLDKAAARLQEILRLDPTPENIGQLAELLVQVRRPDLAQKLLETLGDKLQTSAPLTGLLGLAFAAQNLKDQAKAKFVEALQKARTFVEVGEVADRIKYAWGRVPAIRIMEPASMGANRGWIQMVMAQYELEEQSWQAALNRLSGIDLLIPRDAPERFIFNRMFSAALHQTGEFKQARDVYLEMLKADPNNVAVLNNLAYLLTNDLKESQEGLKYAQKAAARVPNDPQVLDTLGWCQFHAGQYNEALTTLRRSVDRKAMPVNVYHLAKVLIATNARRSEIVETLKRAKELAEKANDVPILLDAAKILREMGEQP